MRGIAGLQVAIVAMGGGAWKVRNAASLIFTALLIRMLGFRNLVKVGNLIPWRDWCIRPCLSPALDPAPALVPVSALTGHAFALVYAPALAHAFTLAFAFPSPWPLPLPVLLACAPDLALSLVQCNKLLPKHQFLHSCMSPLRKGHALCIVSTSTGVMEVAGNRQRHSHRLTLKYTHQKKRQASTVEH